MAAARVVALAMCALLWGVFSPAATAQLMPAPLAVGNKERVLVVAAHPDDETLAAGGLIQRVLERGGTVRILFITSGDGYIETVEHATRALQPRPAEYIRYGERRLREAREAVQILAPAGAALQLLDLQDGGLDDMLRAHVAAPPESHAAAGDASEPSASDDEAAEAAGLRAEITRVLRDVQPTTVVLPDLQDRHPDHRATGMFTILALGDWQAAAGSRPPRVLTYLIHWPSWPPGAESSRPVYRPETPLLLPQDLGSGAERVSLRLSDAESDTKRAALVKYKTQNEVVAPLLASFVRRTEPFTLLPSGEIVRLSRTGELDGKPASPTRP